MDLQCNVTQLLTGFHERPQNSLRRTVENKTEGGKQLITGGNSEWHVRIYSTH